MDPDYSIGFDERGAVMTVRVQGFWTRDVMTAFSDAFVAKINELGGRGTPFTVLVDASDFPVQSVWVSTGFIGIVHRLDRRLWVPTAIVATRALLRFQALRVLVAPHIRVFPDRTAALGWLADSRDGRRAA